MLAKLTPHRGYLGATEGILVMVAGFLAFTAIITAYNVTDCGMCAVGRLAPWVDLLGGISFVSAGLFLRIRRPDNPLWILLILAGFGRMFEVILVQFPMTFFVSWQAVRNLLLIAVPAHVALVFPTGRALRWFRLLVPNVYLWAIAATVIRAMASDRTALTLHHDTTALRGGLAAPDSWQLALDLLPRWGTVSISLGGAAIVTRWVLGNRATKRAFATMFVVIPFALLETISDYLPFLPPAITTWAIQVIPLAIPVSVALGIVGPRLWEGRISLLIRDLDSAATARDVEVAVRRALEDPGVKVALQLPMSDSFADVTGEQMEVALDDPGRTTPVMHEGEIIGALVHSPTSDLSLMEAVARTAALALRRIQLQTIVQVQLAEVTKSRQRIAAAADEARRGIERDLHDGAQQNLVALAMTLDLEKGRFTDPLVHAVLDDAASQVRLALEEIRRLSRGMYPPVLYSDGLAIALQGIADSSPVPVEMVVDPGRFAPHVEATTYFIVAEVLTNIAKHAQASRARVEVTVHQGSLLTEIIDDGIGGAAMTHGSGLQGLEDRVQAMGGALSLHSPPDGGTTLLASIPL